LRGVETEFVELCHRRALPVDDLEAIVTGVEMDLHPREFQTHEDLKHYCYHVASAVGLVSIEIFGYEDPATKDYAEQLGYALQWTNILRDVGEDSREGRVFLPKDVMEQFGLTTESVLSGNPDKAAFLRLMKDQTFVARRFYESARRALPDQDRKSMRSAELMRRIYSAILDRMEADGFHVFEKRYRLSKARMIMEFLHAKFVG
jgi:phytoene synthase